MPRYSLERKRAVVAIYKHAHDLKQNHGLKGVSPMNLALAAAGGATRRQIFHWLREDLSDEAFQARLARLGSQPMFTEDQVGLVVGFACCTRSNLRTLSADTIKNFCFAHLGKKPSSSTVSRILNEHGFTSQKALTRNSRMVSEDVVDDAIGFLSELREHGYAEDQILFMDETGLWSHVKAARTYHFKSWCVIPIFFIFRHFRLLPIPHTVSGKCHIASFSPRVRFLASLLHTQLTL